MMFYLHLLSGTSLTALLSYWLPSLLVMSSCAWILSDAVVESTKEEWPQLFKPLTTPLMIMMPEVQPRGKRTVYIATMMVILTATLLAGVGIGYGSRDHQLATNVFTYEGVAVNSRVSERQYWMTIPGYDRQRDFEFCHPLKMPADVIDIKYEQKYGCKQVYGVGFVQPHKERSDAATIQTGRDSATATEATARLAEAEAQAGR
jgi:hypothetical protein